MKKATLCFTFLLVCAASSMLLVQQVSVNYNHNANFSQLHTYAWGSDDKNKIQNSILAQVAQQDIETAMQQKGLQKVQESQNPDLILTANSRARADVLQRLGYARYRRWLWRNRPQQNVEATMIVFTT